MKRTLFTLCFALLFGHLVAADVIIAGQVFFGDDPPQPTGGYPVEVRLFDGQLDIDTLLVTDSDGFYELAVPYDFSPALLLEATISVLDFCLGVDLQESFQLSPDAPQVTGVNFYVCEDIVPPPPPQQCQAFFTYELFSDNPLQVQFWDLSYSNTPIQSWTWDFGDGNNSTEPDPQHTYPAEGVYLVTLTIATDSCTAITSFDVVVGDDGPCDCDFSDYDPVCVAVTGTDEPIFFVNACVAACEGFGPDDFVDCGDICFCPEYYDPVCVATADGDTLTFDNPCFAACEGFDEGDYFSCSDPAFCDCPLEFDPVCVAMDDGTVMTLFNACFAACLGYGPDSFVDCSSTDPCDCPDEFDPVCVITVFGEIFTFPNACYADCAGFGPDSFVDCADDCFCPDFYAPVCVATADGDTLTFDNPCYAECEGYGPDAYFDCDPADPCDCPDEFDPVCVTLDDGTIFPFPNVCLANCAGFGDDQFVDCTDDCICPQYFDPVCVLTAAGDTLSFENACYAECEGFGPDEYFECTPDNGCDDVFDPVCVTLDGGSVIPFPNECYAQQAGFGPDQIGDCPDDCFCPGVYNPVCVVTAAGDTLTFSNGCYAECEGFGPDDYFECTPDDCDCPDVYDPVCVATPSGLIIQFDNACLAVCEGFEPWMFQPCEDTQFCFADFSMVVTDPASLTVTFDAQTWFGDDTPVSWIWDFGDGNTGAGETVTHTYAEEGIYDVTLTVSSDSCTTTVTRHVCVGGGGVFPGPECQAMFFFTQTGADPTVFQFLDLSFGAIESWHWDFGDGSESMEQNPVHQYDEPGIYQVTLKVTGVDGCESSVALLVFPQVDTWYNTECTALFLPFFTPEENLVFFFNLSSFDAVSFEWDFGDGTTSTEPEAVHQYSEPGVYTVTLTITTADGCTNTFEAVLDLDEDNFTGSPEFALLSDTETLATTRQRWSLYPNPVKDDLTLEVTGHTGGRTTLELLNATGQILRVQTLNLPPETARTELSTAALPAGLYFLRLRTPDGLQTLRFIKR